jgi:transcriptional regulator with XRE-family HTH domain
MLAAVKAFRGMGEALAALRKRAGLTQDEVTEKAKLGGGMLSQYENDKKIPRVKTLDKILEVLGADVHVLADELDRVNSREAKMIELAEEVREQMPGTTAAEARRHAELLERLERLEANVKRSREH